MAFIKFIFDVRKNEIVPKLSKVHDTRWPGFDGEKMVKTLSFYWPDVLTAAQPTASKH